MERQLMIIRHGKSSWEHANLADIHRPLNERGKRAAKDMALRLLERGNIPALVFSSPARRALNTARIMCSVWGMPAEDIRIQEEIYEAYPTDLQKVVSRAPEGETRLAIFGHNPGFTMYANQFLPTPLDNLPTAGVVILDLDSADWKNLSRSQVRSSFVDYPKRKPSWPAT